MLTSESNKTISASKPSDYLRLVEQAAASRSADIGVWLAANLISPEAFEAARNDDYDSFLALRAKTIHEALLPLAGWAAKDARVADLSAASDEELEAEAQDDEFTLEDYGAQAVAAD